MVVDSQDTVRKKMTLAHVLRFNVTCIYAIRLECLFTKFPPTPRLPLSSNKILETEEDCNDQVIRFDICG